MCMSWPAVIQCTFTPLHFRFVFLAGVTVAAAKTRLFGIPFAPHRTFPLHYLHTTYFLPLHLSHFLAGADHRHLTDVFPVAAVALAVLAGTISTAQELAGSWQLQRPAANNRPNAGPLSSGPLSASFLWPFSSPFCSYCASFSPSLPLSSVGNTQYVAPSQKDTKGPAQRT